MKIFYTLLSINYRSVKNHKDHHSYIQVIQKYSAPNYTNKSHADKRLKQIRKTKEVSQKWEEDGLKKGQKKLHTPQSSIRSAYERHQSLIIFQHICIVANYISLRIHTIFMRKLVFSTYIIYLVCVQTVSKRIIIDITSQVFQHKPF